MRNLICRAYLTPQIALTPLIATILIRNHRRMELGRIINKRVMLGLKAIDQGWSTYGVVVGVGEVKIQVESLTRHQILGNLTLASGSSATLKFHLCYYATTV